MGMLRTADSPPSVAAPVARRMPGAATVLAIASLGGFLAFLDATIVNVAVPSIVLAFDGATLGDVSWVLNLYNIVFAAFLVPAGRLADLLGRKRVFEIGVVTFTLASMLCALAPSLSFLVLARAFQALGAAIVVPSSLGLVMVAFPGREQARGIALWSAGAALAAGVGPAAGGALIQFLDWRWCFLINLPIGLLAWRLSSRQLVESRAPGRRRVPDLRGALVLAAAVGALTLGIVQGGVWGRLNVRTLAAFALGLVLLGWFVRRCRRHRSPVVDLALLRVRGFSVANVLTIAAAMGFYGYILCNVLYLTVVWRYSALDAGLALTPGPFVAALIAVPLGHLATRLDPRVIIVPGGLVWALGLVYMITRVGPQPAFVAEWLPGMVILGIGAGATLPTLGSAAAGAAPGGAHATATALNSVARQLGAVLGVAILVAIIGSPAPAAVRDAFHHGWAFTACCLAVAAIGALVLGRVRTAESEDEPPAAEAANGAAPRLVRPAVPALNGAAAGPRPDEPLAAFLGRVTIFAGMPEERLRALADGSRRRFLAGGEVLFERGEPAASMFIVRSGRLEVLKDGEVVALVAPGEVVGELALLSGAPRAATVRARRDSLLLELPREHLEELIDEVPGFARSLVRVLGERLQHVRGDDITPPAAPALIAVVSLDHGDAAALARDLAAALGDVAAIAPPEAAPDAVYAERVARAEHERGRVVLTGGAPGDGWTAFCIRHADRVLAVTAGACPPGFQPPGGLRGCDLVLAGPAGEPVGGWLDALEPRTTHRAAPGDRGAVALMARRLSGTSVGLVLSGGGARGLAHLGALEELLAAGVVVDRVGGTSMGAFIAGMYAAGMDLEEMDARCYEEWVRRRPLSDYGVPRSSVIRGRRVREMLWRTFSGPIELLPRPFFCVSVDLLSGELHVHRRGSLGLAVGASMDIPGVAPPLAAHGRLLVDGGLLNNLPVDVMAAAGEGPVIAVDVSGGARMVLEEVREERLDGAPQARRRPGPFINEHEEDLDVLLPTLPELMTRIVTLSATDSAALAAEHADLVIRPEVSEVGLFEFHMLDTLKAAGRRAAREALG